MLTRNPALDPLFPCLALRIDPFPRPAAANMALDEALLRAALAQPVLRFYHWLEPAFTFGYFQKWRAVASMLPPGVAAVRRWTGGGLVDHRHDLTYSLVIPASHPLTRAAPRDCYQAIHERLAATLQSFGIQCHLAAADKAPASARDCCFAGGHARHDVLLSSGKIAGAAQRRHRLGVLHQGSLALPDLPESFRRRFAVALAAETFPLVPPEDLEMQTAALAGGRYGTAGWLHLR